MNELTKTIKEETQTFRGIMNYLLESRFELLKDGDYSDDYNQTLTQDNFMDTIIGCCEMIKEHDKGHEIEEGGKMGFTSN